jgi:hypothetical protein
MAPEAGLWQTEIGNYQREGGTSRTRQSSVLEIDYGESDVNRSPRNGRTRLRGVLVVCLSQRMVLKKAALLDSQSLHG